MSSAPAAPVLARLRPFAALALLAAVLGKTIGPSAAGIAVGLGRFSDALDKAGSVLSQLFALGGTAMLVGAAAAVQKARVSIPYRVATIVFGGIVAIVSVSASGMRALPRSYGALVAVSAGLLALASAWSARSAAFARGPAVALAAFGLAAIVRAVGMPLAFVPAEQATPAITSAARGVATATFAIDAAAVLVATGWIAARGKRLATPATLVAVAIALLCTRLALHAERDAAAGPLAVLMRSAASRLVARPEPSVRSVLPIFVGFFALTAAGAALISQKILPALGGAVALLLVSRGTPEAPLCALAMSVSSLGVALVARDDRSFWAAITSAEGRGGGGASPEAVTASEPADGAALPASHRRGAEGRDA